MTSCYTVYSTWWSSLKAKWQLITIIIKTIILVAIIKKIRLALWEVAQNGGVGSVSMHARNGLIMA